MRPNFRITVQVKVDVAAILLRSGALLIFFMA